MRPARLVALLACAALLVACSDDRPESVQRAEPTAAPAVAEYDATLEPSAAVLPLVPAGATRLEVTDFDQLRLVLGYGSLDGRSAPEERARFWSQVPRTAALSRGLLRAVDGPLRERFGFGQDDVAWEARYAGDVGSDGGWVLALHPDVPMAAVQRAVRARVGPLRGAVVDPDLRLVSSAEAPAPEESWGALGEFTDVTGRQAVSTYVRRGCVDFADVFGAGVEDELAAAPAAAVRALDPLEAFGVAFGGELATVLLGRERSDAFDRLRLAEVLPPTEPDLSVVLQQGAADPSTGRLGYVLADPPAAARLAVRDRLPFAVCAS